MPEACIMYLYTNLRHTLLIHILILYCSNIPYSQYFVNFQFIDSFIIYYVVYTAPLTGTCTPIRQP